jgi:hypothetical protein
MLNELYEPDGKRLTTLVMGAPGSGKSKMVQQTLLSFSRSWSDENGRIIFCCPKGEMDLGEGTYTPMHKLEKHMSKNRISVVHPDPMNLENEVAYLINFMFDVKDANPDFKAVIAIDDAQIFLDSKRSPDPAWKRLTLTGRSRGLRLLAIAHEPVFHKLLEGSTSYIVHFRTLLSPLRIKDFMNRYGYDPQPHIQPLNEVPYSHVMFDVTTGKSRLMKPLELK